MFIEYLFKLPHFYLTWVALIIFSICVHEVSHAWMALREGDPTAANQGYLTLNPLKVMGHFSLLMAAFLGFAWGAVPVNPARFRRKSSHAIVSAAGPVANLVLALVFGILLAAVARFSRTESGAGMDGIKALIFFFSIAMEVNIFLLLFNLLPIPILDGWEIFCLLIPRLDRISKQKARQAGMFMLLLVLVTGMHYVLWDVAEFLVGKVANMG